MRRTLLASPVLVLLLLVLGLAGCGSTNAGTAAPSTTTTPASASTACQGLAAVNRALASLSTAGEHATVGQLKALQSAVSVAIAVVDKVIPADSGATLDQLKSANDQLGQILAGLPEGDTLSQHSAQLQEFKQQVAKAQAAANQLGTRLNCANPA